MLNWLRSDYAKRILVGAIATTTGVLVALWAITALILGNVTIFRLLSDLVGKA